MKEHTQLSLLFSLHDTANYFSFNLVILCLCISCFHRITYFPLSILINNTKYAFSNITLTFKERKFEGKLGSFIYCLKKLYHRSKGVKAILANTWLRIILRSVLMLSHTCLNCLEYIDCWGLKNKQTNEQKSEENKKSTTWFQKKKMLLNSIFSSYVQTHTYTLLHHNGDLIFLVIRL